MKDKDRTHFGYREVDRDAKALEAIDTVRIAQERLEGMTYRLIAERRSGRGIAEVDG